MRKRRVVQLLLWALAVTLRHVSVGEWQWQYPTPQGNTLWKVAFANDRIGYAVGDFGTIMATYDGGATWFYNTRG